MVSVGCVGGGSSRLFSKEQRAEKQGRIIQNLVCFAFSSFFLKEGSAPNEKGVVRQVRLVAIV